MREVADEVFQVPGTHVNWVLIREGKDLLLVDGGWRNDFAVVEASIRRLGRPEDLRAILLTHAHLDHLGAVNRLHEQYGIPVHAHPREVPHARREYLEQASARVVLPRLALPGMLPWLIRVVASGGLRSIRVPHARPFPLGGPLDLPGRPVPVPSSGHTSGHCGYHLPERGVLLSGDALVTGHPLSREIGPQILPSFFSHSVPDVLASLDDYADLDAHVIVPGHGDAWVGSPAEAVNQARSRARAKR